MREYREIDCEKSDELRKGTVRERQNGVRKGVKGREGLMGRKRFGWAALICSGGRAVAAREVVGQR